MTSLFTLHITTHAGRGLPIADISTSDPYIVLTLDDRVIGKTKTVYRNLNPEWEESFQIPLLHVNCDISLKVFDEDKLQDDDLMGEVIVDVSALSGGLDIVNHSFLLQKAGEKQTIVPKGHLIISANVVRSEHLVSLEQDMSTHTPSFFLGGTGGGEVKNGGICFLKDTIELEMSKLEGRPLQQQQQQQQQINPIHHALLTVDEISFLSLDCSKDIVRDLLWDVASAVKEGNSETLLRVPMSVYRVARPNISSTLIQLDDNHLPVSYSKASPISQLSIRLLFLGQSPVDLIFPNKYNLWICLRWLKFLFKEWGNKHSQDSLPNWIEQASGELKVSSVVLSIVGSESRKLTGTLSLRLDRPFELMLCEPDSPTRVVLFTANLKLITGLLVSCDAASPKSHILQVEVISADLSIVPKAPLPDAVNQGGGIDGGSNAYGIEEGINLILNKTTEKMFNSFVVMRSDDGVCHTTLKHHLSVWHESIYLDSSVELNGNVDFFVYYGTSGLEKVVAHCRLTYASLFEQQQEKDADVMRGFLSTPLSSVPPEINVTIVHATGFFHSV